MHSPIRLAAILLGCSADLASSVERLRRRRIPLVAIEAPPLGDVVPIELDNADGALRSGGFCRAAIVVEQAVPALVVPRAAVQVVDGATLVFLKIEDDLYEARRVRVTARPTLASTRRRKLSPTR